MNLDALTLEALMQGYTTEPDSTRTCLVCGARFSPGEVYPVEGRWFAYDRAAALHLEREHSDYLTGLLRHDSKYNTLTDNQVRLLELIAAGLPDKEIARALDISPSTVRHQRFMFREKAKQARLYLAVYELAMASGARGGSEMMPIHNGAKMVDQRYVVTREEREHILETSFESLSPLRLGQFSPKEKKKVVILAKIAEQFQPGRDYSEGEVNEVLREIYADFATLRRYLIQYGFMDRTKDGARYWLT